MALQHTRSHSFPSASIRVVHNNSSRLGPASTLSSFSDRINDLKKLYDNVDDLLLQPHIQHFVLQERKEKWIDDILDGYIRLLDACETAKDLFSSAKEDLQRLLSSIRRGKSIGDFDVYLNSRRQLKKLAQKSLKITATKTKQSFQTGLVVEMLTEVESATLSVVESLLYAIGAKSESSWTKVSNLMSMNYYSKIVSTQTKLNEFNKVDVALLSFIESRTNEEDGLLSHLKTLESGIQIVEEGLELLFRRLIKTRVFLLNILNH